MNSLTLLAKNKNVVNIFGNFHKVLKFLKYFQDNYLRLRKNPSYFLMKKIARLEIVRDLICKFYETQNRADVIQVNTSSVFGEHNVEEIVASLKGAGYSFGIFLPEPVIKDILNYAYTKPCCGDRNLDFSFQYPNKEQLEEKLQYKFRIASYMQETCPAVQNLERDPLLLAIATKFLGTAPGYVANELMWSFPRSSTWIEQLKTAQVFHYDIDDYRSVKFFFYLTDVDELSGPHILIHGTQRHKKFFHQLAGERTCQIPDEKIVQAYGAENLVTICGKAGFGFVEDSCCFHRGTVPVNKHRLMLQIEYTINNYGNLREIQFLPKSAR